MNNEDVMPLNDFSNLPSCTNQSTSLEQLPDYLLSAIVYDLYNTLLGRNPESFDVVRAYCSMKSIHSIISSIVQSSEFINKYHRSTDSPLSHYKSMFNAEELLHRFARNDLQPNPMVLTNFIGVLIEERYLPSILAGKAGSVEAVPIPANWHADIAEWAAALRAVELAKDTFVVAELGCGWGCWLNNTGVAARSKGLQPMLIGVEGDPGHIEFAHACCELNGFDPQNLLLHHGIAGASDGIALFPKQESAGLHWGLKPIFDLDQKTRTQVMQEGKYVELEVLSLRKILGEHRKLDLLHIDIQGGELEFVCGNLKILLESVAYIVIGTHSREIEGMLISVLGSSAWILEVERPAIVDLTFQGPLIRVDGVQGWRNRNLLPIPV